MQGIWQLNSRQAEGIEDQRAFAELGIIQSRPETDEKKPQWGSQAIKALSGLGGMLPPALLLALPLMAMQSRAPAIAKT
jgi:hypothetical protein